MAVARTPCRRLCSPSPLRDAGANRLRLASSTSLATKNEILYSLNKPDDFILAIVEFRLDGTQRAHYVRRPFHREPNFGVTSVNYDFAELRSRSAVPS